MPEWQTDPSSPERRYYENEALWAQDFESDAQERARLDAVSALVSPDVRSVLDVGCGNGAFVNRLHGKYQRVCGADRSQAALRFVRGEKRLASADALPFAAAEFDLVACLEVIEHLPVPVYERTLREIVRVARSWIVISVPYREDRRVGLVRCPRCLCEFNRSYHLRDFDEARMRDLFGGIDGGIALTGLHHVGSSVRYLGLRTARRFAEPFRKLPLPAGVVCPQCAHQGASGASASSLSGRRRSTGALGRARAWWPHRTQPRWCIGVYRKP